MSANTATRTAVLPPATSCPVWCDDHIGDLHQRRLGDTAGQLQIVLERQDHDGTPGRAQLSFRFCGDGELIDDSTEFPLDVILDVLRAGRK